MPPFKVVSDFAPAGDQPNAIEALSEGVRAGNRFQTLLGVTGSGKTATMAFAIEQVQRPALVIAHNKTLAAQLCNEFREFFPKNAVEYFVSYYDYYQPEAYVPSKDLYIEKDSAINQEVDRLRHAATAAVFARRDVIVVASVSCIYGLGSPETYEMNMQILNRGQEIDRDMLLRKLVSIQYTRNDSILSRGSFRVRGETLEVFPAYAETAFRATMFGDEVERLSGLRFRPSRPTKMEIAAIPKAVRELANHGGASHFTDDAVKRAIQGSVGFGALPIGEPRSSERADLSGYRSKTNELVRLPSFGGK